MFCGRKKSPITEEICFRVDLWVSFDAHTKQQIVRTYKEKKHFDHTIEDYVTKVHSFSRYGIWLSRFRFRMSKTKSFKNGDCKKTWYGQFKNLFIYSNDNSIQTLYNYISVEYYQNIKKNFFDWIYLLH